jgi:hypothetical protein
MVTSKPLSAYIVTLLFSDGMYIHRFLPRPPCVHTQAQVSLQKLAKETCVRNLRYLTYEIRVTISFASMVVEFCKQAFGELVEFAADASHARVASRLA